MPPSKFPASIASELGSPGQYTASGFPESWEETAELRWPQSILVYDRMRKSDGQIAAVRRAIRLPLLRAHWRLTGDEVSPEVMAFVEAELGLPDPVTGRRRRADEGIRWPDFLQTALLFLDYGHMPFEQVYSIGPPPPGLTGLPTEMAHLSKLAPRMPRTVWQILVDPVGDLDGIRQLVPRGMQYADVTIPSDRLLFLCNEREGSDWAGQSIHRAAYKHWLLKDILLRIGPIAVEKNAVGLPVVYYGAGGNESKALSIASNVRAGEYAGVALKDGEYRMELLGVQGSVRDELPLLNYHDQAMGRSSLTMFLNLGHDNGARALGTTFVDFFSLALQAVGDYVGEAVTEGAIADMVRLNFGADAPYPELVCEDLSERSLDASGLAELVKAGVLTPDLALESDTRRRYRLPPPDPMPEPAAVVEPPLPPDAAVAPDPAATPSPPPVTPTPGRPVVVGAHVRAVPTRRTGGATSVTKLPAGSAPQR